jgi:hypothetical protein
LAFHDRVRQLLEALAFEDLVYLIRVVHGEIRKRKCESKRVASLTRASDGECALPATEGRTPEQLQEAIQKLLDVQPLRGAQGGEQRDAITSAEEFMLDCLAGRLNMTQAQFEEHVTTRPEALRGIAKSCGNGKVSLPKVGSEAGLTLSACLASLSVVCMCARARV